MPVYLSQVRVGNYKSFVDSNPLSLGPGVNVICGQNNAGKTALLEALDPSSQCNPHRSLITVPTPQTQPDPTSWVEMSFCVTRAQLLEFMREQAPRSFTLPWPQPGSAFQQLNQHRDSVRAFVESFLGQTDFTFRLRREFGRQIAWIPARFPTFGLYPVQPNTFARFTYDIDGTTTDFQNFNGQGKIDIGLELQPAFQNRIYRFSAERMNVGACQVGINSRLAPGASNLPEVLNVLQGNTPKFRFFNELVHEVLPQIYQISVTPPRQNEVEIRVWTLDPDAHDRLDLAMPLAQCGTGIGQVLAILYVAVFSHGPHVLVIDEPQSFLHPGAVTKLVNVLKTRSKHQYIVTTHSPTVISASDPATITMCRITDGVSTLTPIDPNDRTDLQSYLAEVGARLSDVFGADTILWVEGRTEEVCFPLILEQIGRQRLRGTTILAVSNTGDLQKRDAERVFEMYNRLSQRRSLLPPAVGFIFDTECRTREEKAELISRSRGLLKFLPRRMYENYLLNPEAIAAVANEIEGFSVESVTAGKVGEVIAEMVRDSRHACPAQAAVHGSGWAASANAAEVLREIFSNLSQSRVRFDKVKHAVRLTRWLIDNSPDDLTEILDLVKSCLPEN
jgi:hypothetical protein